MVKMNLFEKMNHLFTAFSSSPILVLSSVAILLIFGYFMFQNEQNEKTKQNILMTYALLFIFVLLQYSDDIFKLIHQISKLYYTPSLSILFILFLVLNFIAVKVYLSKDENKNLERKLSMAFCAFSWILLVALFAVIHKDHIELLNLSRMYQNKTILSISQLFMNLCILYFAGKALIFLIQRFHVSTLYQPTSLKKNSINKEETIQFQPVTNLRDNKKTKTNIPVELEKEVLSEQIVEKEEPQVMMQQGIPIIMDLEKYYTKDPLEEYEIEVEKELQKPKKEKRTFIQKLVPVVEKKEEQIAVEMKPVISYQTKEKSKETGMENYVTVAKEIDAKSSFQHTTVTPSYFENDDIISLKKQYDAIDEEIEAFERKKVTSE